MKNIISILALIILTSCMNIQAKQKPMFLYVQRAESGNFDGKILKLNDISKNTILFSDRPYRIVRHIENKQFIKIWNNKKDKDSFRNDPPNAAISYYNRSGKPDVAVIEISNFKANSKNIFYNVKILEGKLPKEIKEVTLFIDACAGGDGAVEGALDGPEGASSGLSGCGVYTDSNDG